MCGICGFVGPADPELLRAMTYDLRVRGPDGSGVYEDAHASLGHRRLAIIDLVTGDQPMRDGAGRVLVYNGEVYNYRELRAELARGGVAFRTTSDTEVLLAAVAHWGLGALERLEGIFAFALWEPAERRLLLARDPLGVKPLRYRIVGDRLYFASEARALFRTPGFDRAVRPGAIDAILGLRYDPQGDVLADATALPPGHSLVFAGGRAEVRPYWSPPVGREPRSIEEDVGRFGELFDRAVESQLVADVPVGLFLSGGLDSSALLDAATKAGARKMRTFSIGFGTSRDELAKAERVAGRYGAEHRGFVLSPETFLESLPAVFGCFDEPVLDAVQVAVWLLAKAAAREVKVVLTGEGADEILAGYVHHRALGWAALVRPVLPRAVARLMSGVVSVAPVGFLQSLFAYPARLGPGGRQRVARLVASLPSVEESYLAAASLWSDDERAAIYTKDFRRELAGAPSLGQRVREHFPAGAAGSGDVDRVVRYDLSTWLPNNVLMRLDRLTMGHGLEGRVPYLHRPLVEHALTSPHLGPPWPNKVLLRRAMRERLPRGISRQRKQGFYLPLEHSSDARLRALMNEILRSDESRRRNVVDPGYVESLLASEEKGELLGSKRLFALFAFELWMQQVVDPAPAPPPSEVLTRGIR